MVPQRAIEDLKKHLRGQLLCPGDPGYDDTRRIWNGMIDKRPALIARCSGAGDVIQGVKFARQYELAVSVCGGGHNIAGKCVSDGGMTIDLRAMKGVRSAARVAWRTAGSEKSWGWAEHALVKTHGLL